MPIKYKILENKKFVYVVGVGKVTLAGLLEHIDKLAHDPAYKSPMKKLVDYNNTPALTLSPEEIRIFTQKKMSYKDKFAREKCAIVAPVDVDFGMARVHGANIEMSGIDTNVFRSIEKALAWLDVEVNAEDLSID